MSVIDMKPSPKVCIRAQVKQTRHSRVCRWDMRGECALDRGVRSLKSSCMIEVHGIGVIFFLLYIFY